MPVVVLCMKTPNKLQKKLFFIKKTHDIIKQIWEHHLSACNNGQGTEVEQSIIMTEQVATIKLVKP